MKSSDEDKRLYELTRIVREALPPHMLSETQINPSVKVVRAHVALDRLEARIAEQQAELDADDRSVHLLNSFYVNLVRDAKRAEAAEARLVKVERERDEWKETAEREAEGWHRAWAAEARVKELAVALNRVIYIAEHLFQMVPRGVWRDAGGDDMQGHYEGDYYAEQVRTELADFRVALATDIPGPCDETSPLFSQGGEATTFYAGKKFDRDNQLGNDGLK